MRRRFWDGARNCCCNSTDAGTLEEIPRKPMKVSEAETGLYATKASMQLFQMVMPCLRLILVR